MKIIKDDLTIIELLDKAAIRISDYATSQVISFEISSDFYLVIYSAEKNKKGFILFSIADHENTYWNLEDWRMIVQKESEEFGRSIANSVMEELEKLIFRIKAKNLFYDAH